MKITVKYKKTEIIVDETDNHDKERKTTIKWSDQMEAIHKTIIVMVEQCILLKKKD